MNDSINHPIQNKQFELIAASEMHHPSGSRIYTHARKSFGLIYAVSGSAIYDFDGVAYPVKEGEVFCIPQKLPFSLRPVQKNSYNTRQFSLLINDPELQGHLSSLHPPLPVDPTLKTMLDYIFRFWTAPARENQSLVEAFVRAILAQFFVGELSYDNPVSSYVLTDGYSPATKKALSYIEINRIKPFSLEEMSRVLGYNKNYLCSAFSRDTGVSVLEYAHFQKIRQAMIHFFYWGTELSEVRELLGFDSPSYFNTLFKSVAGISPGAFRRVCLSLDGETRTEINISTMLFVSRPLPITELFDSMKQLSNRIKAFLPR